MTGCECCHTSVPCDRYPRETELPNGDTIMACAGCRCAIRYGDFSTVPADRLD